jgi:hypothetical protein
MTLRTSCLSVLMLTYACGSVHSPLTADAAPLSTPNDAGALDASAVATKQPSLTIRFPDPPADLPRENLRAALVWTDVTSYQPSEGDLVEASPEIRSDIAVEPSSPFVFELAYNAPDQREFRDFAGIPEDPRHDKKYYSLPSAEVILYIDHNENGQLDLLPLGHPGPGPDRVIALSRGRDRQANAKRSLLVHKKNPVSNSGHTIYVPSLAVFLGAGLTELTPEEEAAAFPDGLYILTLSVSSTDPLAQEALLSSATELPNFLYGRRDTAYMRFAFGDVEPARDSSITLYEVDPDRASWLPRACVPLSGDQDGMVPLPPPGAAIQCERMQLLYATSPDDYCGQVGELSLFDWQERSAEPWPCGPNGLIENTPYVVSTRRLDGHPLQGVTAYVLTGNTNQDVPADWKCRSAFIYDIDRIPHYHMPTVAPEPGSQVRCYSRDSLSYVPPRSDGCHFKYSYELSSESYENPVSSGPDEDEWNALWTWDMRAQPPAWWPCDENGELRADSPYEAPRELPEVNWNDCEFSSPRLTAPDYPPPPNSQVHCLSATEYRLRPLWSDSCDGASIVAQSGSSDGGSWSVSNDPTWPCDAEGNFIPRIGISAY